MKNLQLTLSVFLICFFSANAFSQNAIVTETAIRKDNGYFAYMQKPEWLVIGSDTADIDIEVHLPRIKTVSELTWSQDNRYLTFTTKDRQHWLYDLQYKAISLLESVPASHTKVKYSPQWSGDSKWLLFISHQYTGSRPRIYSVERKHSYALPISTNQFSSIAWADISNTITLSDFVGNSKRIASFSALGITLEQAENDRLTVLHK